MEKERTESPPQTQRPFFKNALMQRVMFFWLIEIGLSGINFFIPINLIYEPSWGEPLAHQIGMSTRIVYTFLLVYLMLRRLKDYRIEDLLAVGAMWMATWLVFEWGGSLAVGRPVSDILVGWNVFNGYMWPYVLLSYLLAPLVVGEVVLRAGRRCSRVDRGNEICSRRHSSVDMRKRSV